MGVILMASSCKKDDTTNNSTTANTPVAVSNIVMNGTWKVTYFFDGNTDKTSNYTGYSFKFLPNNVLTATKAGVSVNGTWTISDSNTSNNDNLSDLDFNILFSTPAEFYDLTHAWDIVEKTSTSIKLTDVSGGNGGTKFLTFIKN